MTHNEASVQAADTRPRQAIDGILVLDKPRGLSSNQALGRVKYLLGARKAGHTGALDPLATGLLPLCFGQATKVSGWLLDADKHYIAVAQLGTITATGDAEGQVVATHPVPAFTAAALEAVCEPFRGVIQQVPPMYSALKHQGQPLYKLARQGQTIPRAARQVTIHALSVNALAHDRLQLEVHCSKGTYIRSLVHDLGAALGCGATVVELRRLGHGVFDAQDMHCMEAIEAAATQGGSAAVQQMLLPADQALSDQPAITLDASSSQDLCQGKTVATQAHPPAGVPLRMYDAQGHFLGIGESRHAGYVVPRRLFVSGSSPSCSSA